MSLSSVMWPSVRHLLGRTVSSCDHHDEEDPFGTRGVTRAGLLLAFVIFACWSTCCGTPSCWTRPCQKLEVVKLGWPVKVMVHCEMSASSPVPIRVTSSVQQRCSCKGLEALDTHLSKSKWYLLYSSEIIEPWCVWVLDTYQYLSITHGWITLCELWLSQNQYDCVALCIQIHADRRASVATPLF